MAASIDHACAQMVAGKRGRVPPPFQALLPSPTLCTRAQSLGEFLRYDSALPPRLTRSNASPATSASPATVKTKSFSG